MGGEWASVAGAEVDVDCFVHEIGFLGAVSAEAAGGVRELVAELAHVEIVGFFVDEVADRAEFVDDVVVIGAELGDTAGESGLVGGDLGEQAGGIGVGSGLRGECFKEVVDGDVNVMQPCRASSWCG